MKKFFYLLFLLFPALGFSQEIFQVDFLIGKIQYKKNGQGAYQVLKKATLLGENTLIRTGRNARLRLQNSSGIKILIRGGSTIRLSQLQPNARKVNLYTGEAEFQIRKTLRFQVHTPTMVAGVRGTLFKVSSVPSGAEKVVVYDGEVAVSSPLFPKEKALSLKEGYKMEWKSAEEDFSSKLIKRASGEELKFEMSENILPPEQEKKLAEKPQENVQAEQEKPLEEAKETKVEEKKEEGKKKEKDRKTTKIKPKKLPKKDKFWNLDISLGGIRKDGFYYHAFVLKPEIKLGKWTSFGLYFPMYYGGKSAIYDVTSWGNSDEWNFEGSKDAAHDALLKIAYFKFREKGDLLFLAVGRMEDLTLGTGFMVNHFDNSPLFPAERKVGLEAGFDIGGTGLSFFVADFYNPEVIGGRFFLRPLYGIPVLGKFEIGLQVVTDKSPIGEFNNPAFFAIGMDIIFPLIDTRAFSISFFGDVGKQGAYYRDEAKKPANIADGKDILHFHINDNYGVDLGVKGNITEYALYEARYYYLHTGYVVNYFDRFYLVNRQAKMQQVLSPSLSDAHAFHIILTAKIPELFQATLGYYTEYNSPNPQSRGLFSVKTVRGALYKFWLKLDYEKIDVHKVFSGESYKTNAILDLRIGYMISDNSDLVIRKLINYDENGNQQSQILLETGLVF